MTRISYILSDINKAVFFEHTVINLHAQGVESSWIMINSKRTNSNEFHKVKYFPYSEKQIVTLNSINYSNNYVNYKRVHKKEICGLKKNIYHFIKLKWVDNLEGIHIINYKSLLNKNNT